jgi:hypothetical protein
MMGAFFLAVFVLSYAGLALLALSQSRNWTTIAGNAPLPVRHVPALRIGGSLLLVASLAIAIARDGLAFGAILWTVTLTVAGWLVVLTLAWRARQAGR